jgi:hypothetical protein
MSKSEAIREIARLSSGTIAGIIGNAKYSAIDDAVSRWIITADAMPDDAFTDCEAWPDVLEVVRV